MQKATTTISGLIKLFQPTIVLHIETSHWIFILQKNSRGKICLFEGFYDTMFRTLNQFI